MTPKDEDLVGEHDDVVPGAITDTVFKVTDFSDNPTDLHDRFNANLPTELQFPSISKVPTIDSPLDDPFHEVAPLPSVLALEHTMVRCYRDKHPTLADAQAFFNQRRIVMRWRLESPIFRTARFWCKRVFQ